MARTAARFMTAAIAAGGVHLPTRQVRFRSAAGTPAADPPAPVQTRTAPPASPPPTPPGNRTADQIAAERARLVGEAEALQVRSAQLTAEESARLDQLIDQAEALDGELQTARRAERLAAQRSRLNTPTRPAPVFSPAQRSATESGDEQAEALRLWLRSHTDDADRSPDAHHRAAAAGFTLGAGAARIPCGFGGSLNKEKRRTLSKGGAGTGAELIPVTYSGKVTEYISYFSPVVGLVDSEVTDDGNKRTYFKVDDTALISTYITASSGTEVNPTIPDSDVTTASVDITVADITSGYHKLTRNVLRDSAITVTDKVTKAIGHSHARKIENDVINGTGNGTTSIQGLIAAGTRYGAAVDHFDNDLFEALYFAMPIQYRAGAIFLFSDTAMAKAVKALKDTTGRSLFGKLATDGLEIRTLFERPCYTSSYMPAYGANAKCVLFFNPMFYMLRVVNGQTIDVLREKFYPHLAYAGGMSFGGAWLGPATANQYLQLDAGPDGT